MKRVVPYAVAALLAVCVSASCAGSDDVVGEPLFTASDLDPVTAVAPVAPGWGWDTDSVRTREVGRDELGRNDSTPVQAELTETLADERFVVLRGATWTGKHGQASSSAILSETVAGAHEIWRATDTFARRYQEEVERMDVAELEVTELGEGAWGLRQIQRGSGATYSVTLGWRRSNVVLQAHIVCSPCLSDLEAALRNWAEAIDREAVRVAARP